MKTTGKRIIFVILGIFFLFIGLFALVTPFTPGALLSIVVGLIFLIDRERTKKLLKFLLGEKLFKKFHIEMYIDKIHS